jgi:hypothetical protein
LQWSPTCTYDRRPDGDVDRSKIGDTAAEGGGRARRPQEVFFSPMMTRRLARKNIRTGLIVAAICMFMFGLTFVVAAIYVS